MHLGVLTRAPWLAWGRPVLARLWGMLMVLGLVSVLVFVLTRLAAGDQVTAHSTMPLFSLDSTRPEKGLGVTTVALPTTLSR